LVGDLVARPEYRQQREADVTEYEEPRVSGWAVAGVSFAAVLLFIVGVFQAIQGLVAIINDEFYVLTENYTFDLDVTAWGVIHLLIGLLFIFMAWGLFSGATWAGIGAIVIATLSAVSNFFFIPYYPFWSIVEIGLAIWVIWALTRPGATEATRG
jgi:hypothetical protein